MGKIIFKLILAVAFSSVGFAHEGHDNTPGAITAPHGGIVKGGDPLYWELVSDASGVKLYPLTHDQKLIPLKEMSVTGTAEFPKKAKKDIVKFSIVDDHYSAQVNTKGVSHYALEITSTYQGKKGKVKFQVEPQE